MKDPQRVRIGAQGMFCQHCGRILPVHFPIEIEVLAAMAKAFSKSHAYCRPDESGATEMAAAEKESKP